MTTATVTEYLNKLTADSQYKRELKPYLQSALEALQVASQKSQSPEGKRFGRLSTAIADALHYTEAAIDALSDFPDE